MEAAKHSSIEVAVRVMGILLIVQGLVRLGFLVVNYLNMPSDVFRLNPSLLAMGFVIPAILGCAALIAGIVMAQLSPVARTLGIAICAVCLAQSIFSLASVAFNAMRTTMRLPWQFWAFGPTFFVLFLVALIVLIVWRPPAPQYMR